MAELSIYAAIIIGVAVGLILFGLYLLFKKLKGGKKMAKKKKAKKAVVVSDATEYDDEPEVEEPEEVEDNEEEAKSVPNPFKQKTVLKREAKIVGVEFFDVRRGILKTTILSNYKLGDIGAEFAE